MVYGLYTDVRLHRGGGGRATVGRGAHRFCDPCDACVRIGGITLRRNCRRGWVGSAGDENCERLAPVHKYKQQSA